MLVRGVIVIMPIRRFGHGRCVAVHRAIRMNVPGGRFMGRLGKTRCWVTGVTERKRDWRSHEAKTISNDKGYCRPQPRPFVNEPEHPCSRHVNFNDKRTWAPLQGWGLTAFTAYRIPPAVLSDRRFRMAFTKSVSYLMNMAVHRPQCSILGLFDPQSGVGY